MPSCQESDSICCNSWRREKNESREERPSQADGAVEGECLRNEPPNLKKVILTGRSSKFSERFAPEGTLDALLLKMFSGSLSTRDLAQQEA